MSDEQPAELATAKAAIVTVGEGRGFFVEGSDPLREHRMIITAAHCLPELPPAHPYSYTHVRTYPNLVGPLGAPPSLAVECVFVDPIADVAVLGAPDNQTYFDEADAYDMFAEASPVLSIDIVTAPCDAWLHTLDGRWERCGVRPGWTNDEGIPIRPPGR